MKTYIKYIVGVLVLVGITYLGVTYPKVVRLAGASPAGTTNLTPRKTDIVWSLLTPGVATAGSAGTTTSILNSDSQDRVIENLHEACTGLGTSNAVGGTGGGLANLIIQAGTTTTATPANLSTNNTVANLIFDNNNIIATSTTNYGFFFLSSSTPGVIPLAPINASSTGRIWGAGTYLTFSANATNTAVCTVGASYIPE